MSKNKKKCIIAIASLFVLMMTAASVNADENDEPGILDRLDVDTDTFAENMTDDSTSIDEEPNLIAPSLDSDEEPLIIAPMNSMKNEDVLLGENAFTAGLILVIGISGFVSLAIALVIFKK